MVPASLPSRFLGKAKYIIMIKTPGPALKPSFFSCIYPTCTINAAGILVYGFIHIEYKIVYTSKLFNLCYKTSRNRWEKETAAVCVYFGQKCSIPFALVLWRKVDGRGKELAGFCLYS